MFSNRTRIRVILAQGSRCFSNALPASRARIDAVDKNLVLLRPNQLQDTGRLRPGAILTSSDGSARVVVAFKLKDGIFGANLTKSNLVPNMVLEQRDDEEMCITDSKKKVFDDPPRDMVRRPITQSWFINEPVMDLMTPLGVGQSMAFFLGQHSNLFQTIEKAMRDQQANLFVPGFGSDGMSNEDLDVSAYLGCHKTIAEAEIKRDEADIPVVVMIPDLTPFRRLWERADALWRQDKHKTRGVIVPEKSPDRTDLRHFYSSFIQRAARLKDGNKSLTMLLRLPKVDDVVVRADPDKEYKLEEFETEVKLGVRSLEDFERLVRLRAKAGNKIKLTTANLAKLQISLPASAGGGSESVIEATQSKFHSEELMSILDGHIVAPNSFQDFCLDPRASLTRIGVGSNKNEVRDTRPALIRSLALGLRIEIADLYESVHANPEKARSKLEAWKRALNLRSQMRLENDKGRFEAALVYGVRKGFFNDATKLPKFNMDVISQLDLAQDQDTQIEILKRCIDL